MTKSIIRLLAQHDRDLRLLPIYFDRLKLFVKIRKLWKYNLENLNRKANEIESVRVISKSFYKWKDLT